MQRRENFFPTLYASFFSVGIFFARYFLARIFSLEISLQDIFFWNHPYPHHPHVKWSAQMITRTRFPQKQVVRAREPASSFSHLGTSYCWEIIVVAETSYHFVIGRRLKLLQKKMTVLTFLVKKRIMKLSGCILRIRENIKLNLFS